MKKLTVWRGRVSFIEHVMHIKKWKPASKWFLFSFSSKSQFSESSKQINLYLIKLIGWNFQIDMIDLFIERLIDR